MYDYVPDEVFRQTEQEIEGIRQVGASFFPTNPSEQEAKQCVLLAAEIIQELAAKLQSCQNTLREREVAVATQEQRLRLERSIKSYRETFATPLVFTSGDNN